MSLISGVGPQSEICMDTIVEGGTENVPGPFLVHEDYCQICELTVDAAPDLMACDDKRGRWSCYFTKQPSTPDEVEQAIKAYAVCCVAAVDYTGDNPVILARIAEIEEW